MIRRTLAWKLVPLVVLPCVVFLGVLGFQTGRDEVLDLVVPLAHGRVQADLDMSGTRVLLHRHAVNAVLWLLFTALLAGLSVSMLMFSVTRRLRRLETAANALRSGDLSVRLPSSRQDDEISRLCAAFNRMAEDIESRTSLLRRANEATLEALMETHEEQLRLETLLASMRVGILFVDGSSTVLYANPALRRIWLVAEESELEGLPVERVFKLSGCASAQTECFWRRADADASESAEIDMGDGRIVTQIRYPVRDRSKGLLGHLWVFEDVSAEKHRTEQMTYLAERDGLTGLSNRRRFEQMLGYALAEADRRSGSVALIFLDIDEFKLVNDHFGHGTGDTLLMRVASELAAVVRHNEVLARLGGDEFAIMATDISDPADVHSLAERITRVVAGIPMRCDGQALRVTGSLGVAIYPDHAYTLTGLMACADMAMYRAKAEGKNCWRVYDGCEGKVCIDRLTWNDRIRHALDHNLLILHYQGIHDTSGRMRHIEALVRMKDQDRPDALISPGHFIPHAERTGIVLEIDRWTIAAACGELARLPVLPGIAVNISARSLANDGLAEYILDMLGSCSVQGERLLLEITETTALSDVQVVRRFVDLLRPAGCQICLDDFGTGFSSFSYLKHLDADVLKIDGQFIRLITESPDDRIVVRAIVDVARGMGKQTVAECVEDEATLQVLCELGVDAVQGYHLSMPRADAASFLETPEAVLYGSS